jgi:hypothetical protein
MQRTLTPTDEKICEASENPKKMRESMARKRFFRTRPDGIAHHNENRITHIRCPTGLPRKKRQNGIQTI